MASQDEVVEQKLNTHLEAKLRNIFIGCLVLVVFIVVHLVYFARGPAGWSVATISVVSMLFWALVVTTYAFHALWRLARRRAERLEKLSRRDSATGVYSWAYMRQEVENLEDRPDQEPGAFGYLKLNGLERVNENFGHAVGNIVLRELAQRVMGTAPFEATVGRLAGQEFCVVMPGMDEKKADRIMRDIHGRVDSYELDLGQRGSVSVEAVHGLVPLPAAGHDLDELVRAARSDAMDRTARGIGPADRQRSAAASSS